MFYTDINGICYDSWEITHANHSRASKFSRKSTLVVAGQQTMSRAELGKYKEGSKSGLAPRGMPQFTGFGYN